MPLHERLLAALPFQLTRAQRRVSAEIAHDLARSVPLVREGRVFVRTIAERSEELGEQFGELGRVRHVGDEADRHGGGKRG